ncbi:MAG: efflux transporter outer membrane subunit [Casimicrobiaceae bacterium]
MASLRRQSRLQRFAALAVLLAAGCTVGPDFRLPPGASSTTYLPGVPARAGAQRFADADDIRADWWALFASPRLDAAVRESLASSPTLEVARARLVEAQQNRTAGADAAAWPSASARAGIERQRIDPAAIGFPQAPNPGPFTLYSVGVDVAFTFDVFGGTRRELEGLAAAVDYQRFELEAAQRTLAANIVTTALRQASLSAQIGTLARIVAAQRDSLAIAQKRFEQGAIATVDVDSQRALLAQTTARMPELRAQLAQSMHQLAVYAGREPAAADTRPYTLADFSLPPEIPLTLPAALAQRRPDVRASEALLHRASADVGVASANLFPKFTFATGGGSTRTSLQDLASGINLWNIGLNLVQPLTRGPELAARKRAAIAAFDAAKAAYRGSVLHALQNVADALRTLEADASTSAARRDQADASRRAYEVTRKRYALGGVSQLALLDAKRTWLEAALSSDQAAAARLADTAALLDALGGRWREPPK